MSNGDRYADLDCDFRLLQLIESVYAAAMGETTWGAVVADVQRAGRFDGVAVVATDRRRHCAGKMLATAGLGRCRTTGRCLGDQPANPLITDAVLRSKSGAIWFDHEILPSALWADTAFRDMWMDPQALVSWACMIIGGTKDRCVYLEVYASAPRSPLGHLTLTMLNRLAPHLSRAWRLAETTHRPTGRARPSADQADTNDAFPPDALLRREFGLTRAEARLALHLASGQSLACAADAFGVRLTTLRSQLAQIYSKTGTGRQCELVSLLLRRLPIADAA